MLDRNVLYIHKSRKMADQALIFGIDVLVGLLVFVLGAAVGSFLNVVVYRLPAGLSLLFPPSRCPHCLTRLQPYENVPILGWLWLKGQCRHCHSAIAVRYPLVETATALLFLLTFLAFGWTWQTISYWCLLSWLLALSLIDLDTMWLPDSLTRSGVVVGLAFQAITAYGNTPTVAAGSNGLITGILGAVLGIWLFDGIRWIGTIALGQPAMGGGDAKLAALIGAWLGWQLVLLTAFLACAVGALIGGGAIALKLIDRRQPVPFGPYLALGAVLAAFWGQTMIDLYLQWLGVSTLN